MKESGSPIAMIKIIAPRNALVKEKGVFGVLENGKTRRFMIHQIKSPNIIAVTTLFCLNSLTLG